MKRLLTLLLIGTGCVPMVRHGSGVRDVRVALQVGVDWVEVGGSYRGRRVEARVFTPDSMMPVKIKPYRGVVTVNGSRYRGTVEIQRSTKGLTVVNVLDMESYLKGVVPCEIGRISEPLLEAAKAQAVAARTYARAHAGQHEDLGFDLYATIQDQVYGGLRVETDVTNKAVDQTRGQILTYQGRPIEAKYHAACGGRTADFGDAWSGDGPPYLRSVPCAYCAQSPHYRWRKAYTRRDFFRNVRQRLARLHVPIAETERITGFRLTKNRTSERVVKVTITTDRGRYEVPQYQIRTLFGDQRDPGGLLRSSAITLRAAGDSVFIEGRGFGHGVGMCQSGAIGMAREGKDYRTILLHYFRGTRIVKR